MKDSEIVIVRRIEKNNPIKAGIGYSIGNILVKSFGIITLPIFSRLLSTEEYGIYSVYMAYNTILSYIIGLTLNVSVKRANIEFPGKIDDYTSSVSLIYKFNLLIYFLLVIFIGNYVSGFVGLSKLHLLLLGVNAEATAYFNLYSAEISLKYSYKEHLKWSAITSIGGVILSLLLMMTVFSFDHLTGRLVGSASALAFVSISLTIGVFCKAKPKWNKKYWKFGLRYCLPIIPNGIAQTLLNQFDRVMIRQLCGASYAGIYSFAGNIRLIVTVISDSIGTVWGTWFFESMEKGDKSKIQIRAFQVCLIFLIFGCVLMTIAPEMLMILGSSNYYDSRYVVIPMIADSIILFFYSVVVQGEYYQKKTYAVLLGTVIATVLNIILNYCFILKYGFVAAAYTTLFAYLCLFFFHVLISKKVLGFYIVGIEKILLLLAILFGYMAVVLVSLSLWYVRWLIMIPFTVLATFLLNESLKESDNITLKNYIFVSIMKKYKGEK